MEHHQLKCIDLSRILTFYGAFRRPCLRAVTSLVTFQLLSSYRIKGIVSHLPSRKSCQGWGLARKEAWRLQQLGQFASALVSLASPRATARGKVQRQNMCVFTTISYLTCLPPRQLASGSIPLASYTNKRWIERSCPIEPWVCYLPLTMTTRSCTWICVDMLGSYWITPLCGLQLYTPLASKYTRPSLTPDGSPLLMIHSSIPKHVPFSGPPSCLLVGSLALWLFRSLHVHFDGTV
ncbi:hypothetical protein DER45DRAFT_347708 [Fusarium avenaceum]|nr:hypothetical protein DER45DRAFT_347708 [Fusarium avenaceum]